MSQEEITEQMLTINDGGNLNRFGESVAISGEFAIVGAPGDSGASSSSGAAYILKHSGSNWTITQKLFAHDGSNYSKFGHSVSISEDYAIVGAYGSNSNGDFSGAAYIYQYNGSNWVEKQKITPNDASSWKKFGLSVSILSNFAIIGASGDSEKGTSSGAAYIFYYDGNNWTQSQKLTAFDGDAWDNFGQAVAISGEYVVIGSQGDSDNGPVSGSAYLFHY